MKIKLLIVTVLLALTLQAWATGEAAKGHTTTAGYQIGDNASAKWATHGVAPTAQQTGVNQTAFAVLQAKGVVDPTATDYSLQHVTKSLTAANLIAMYTTPVVLIAAQGAGKSIVVQKLVFTITRTSTAFTGGGAAIVQYAATANGVGTQALDSTLASTVITGSAGTSISFRNGAVVSDAASTVTQNVGLYISNATAVFAAGTGTASVDIYYYVL